MNHKNSLSVLPIQTRVFRVKENLIEFILQSVPDRPKEGTVLAVTSKIISLAEGRLVPENEIEKGDLIRRESDQYLGEIGYGCHLTVKHGIFIPSAGIDQSNSENGDYILYPLDPFQSAMKIWRQLRDAWRLESFGVVITDSHTTPLRKGVTGISLAHWGFRAIQDMVGKPDLFGRPLQVTTINAADGLAAAATYMMGEGSEAQPLCLLTGTRVEFSSQTDPSEVQIPLEQDLYYPLFQKALIPKDSKF